MSVLYGVGVGPGDPELMTLKAVRIIKECDVIALPCENPKEALAYNIAVKAVREIEEKKLLGIPMPMVKNSEELFASHDMGAKKILSELDAGKSVAFLTLGDPGVYSTFAYIKRIVEANNYSTYTINGITSFLSSAALINQSLVEQDESLHIIPANYGIDEAMSYEGTKIFMKAGKKLKEIKDKLKNTEKRVWFIENCGLDGETVLEGVENIPDQAGYYSILIIK